MYYLYFPRSQPPGRRVPVQAARGGDRTGFVRTMGFKQQTNTFSMQEETVMGFFSKWFKGPEVDKEKSDANAKKMRTLFNQVVENGDDYRLIFGYTEDVSRFNYGFVHGSKTKIGNLIVGFNEATQTIVAVPTVPDLSGCGDPTYYRRSEILKAYRNKYPTDAFVIYPDRKGYLAINAYDWLDDESLYVYVSQEEELAAFTDFFMNRFAKK
jgi:hypothetical protein